ncbi:MAG: hypothetical protein HYU78_13780 [Rhodocyclales bacterium]|nr:hypothetical protein [Rhodocyclales bacterium]
MKTKILAALLVASLPGLAQAQAVAENNGLLTNAAGQTLYTFDKDAADKSHCNGPCAAIWPPFAAQPGAQARGDYSLVRREDGSLQWALKGKPLYLYAADGKPGEAQGDGKGGVWHVVKTGSAAPVAATAPAGYNSGY